jgi:putative FmdB family regulatory protein
MPLYEYRCAECGLQFEELAEKDEEVACAECGTTAERKISDFGYSFAPTEKDGDTGVDSVDHDIDKIVGRDADKRWEFIKDRETRKRQVSRARSSDNTEGAPVKRDPETGDYDVLSEEETEKRRHLGRNKEEFRRQTQENRDDE